MLKLLFYMKIEFEKSRNDCFDESSGKEKSCYSPVLVISVAYLNIYDVTNKQWIIKTCHR